ncbi:hypothetical protein [Pseudomonas kermanshahensis]|uniref:hypothetical protein n=1 Tax=Pseudomonas kermanshahensis TaxID=2745482 RepID=UPI002093866A|nr:hypothetical protein [Pseudomonas kermanshahensis]USS54304.1 hypothetical protein NG836_21215 [Pseudomonas kermanshahensis]
MINLSYEEPIWLVSEDKISEELFCACRTVYEIYQGSYVPGDKHSASYRVRQATMRGSFDFRDWGACQANKVVQGLFWNSEIRWRDVNVKWNFPKAYDSAFSNFLRLVCVVLWARGIFLAPLGLTAFVRRDQLFDNVCKLFPAVTTLSIVRALHAGSSICGVRYDYHDKGRRASLWSRLLLSTTFYDMDDVSLDDVEALFNNSRGSTDAILATYDVPGFIEKVLHGNARAIEYLKALQGGHENFRKEINHSARKKMLSDGHEYVSYEQNLVKEYKSSFDKYDDAISASIEYSLAVGDRSLEGLIKEHFIPVKYKRIFQKGSSFYNNVSPVVKSLIELFGELIESSVVSGKVANDKTARSNFNIIASYLGVYLPRFLLERDGDISQYPATLNDFSCFLYVSWDQQGTEQAFKFEKRPPMTLLEFTKLHVQIHEMSQATHKAKVKSFNALFSYIEKHRLRILDASQFVNTIDEACFPKAPASHGTSKQGLPRKYFSAFISMLYSFEYLTMHLNYMAEGLVGGVIDGELVLTNAECLREPRWEGIWGAGKFARVMDLSLLNYCPIFYSDGLIYRFEFIPRFYQIAKYDMKQEDGSVIREERVIPNDVRVTLIMCETGFRQAHTIWLDLDAYDRGVDRSSDTALTVLNVATDKAHGAWVAVVARHILRILDNQRDWYRICASQSYESDLYYNGKLTSRFGHFKPLFRKSGSEPSGWGVWAKFPIFLLALKYFIEKQVGDNTDYKLASLKSADGEEFDFDDYSVEAGKNYSWRDLSSIYTPHGLRASFITNALNFLPPSIIGQFYTGQTPQLVLYYQLVDGVQVPGHREILADYLSKNLDQYSRGEAPEMADRILRLNAQLAESMKENIPKAIKRFGLVSLNGYRKGLDGLDILISKKFTSLAFNSTHICPFGNKCPQDVIQDYGYSMPCAACPYAIRGTMHLPAISAEKDKYKELMIAVVNKINECKGRKPTSQDHQLIEDLCAEHDHYAREAYTLEAVEQQLYGMHKNGANDGFMVQKKEQLITHFERVKLDGAEYLVKRLCDSLSWVNASSPTLDMNFAYLRARLLMHDGRLEELLNVRGGTPASHLSSVIKSMVDSGTLDVMDLVRLANEEVVPEPVEPARMLLPQLDTKNE